jgi:fructokinase
MPFRCVGLGEVLWDLLPAGRQLGGAPANFAFHAAALGADGRVVSRVGSDEPGRDLLARLRELGLPVDAIAVDPAAPTGTVSVAMEAGGHPRYTIHEGVAWDRLEAGPAERAAVAAADAVCFGSLAQRTPGARAAIAALLDATPAAALRIFDVNLRQHFHSAAVIRSSLARANVLKVNESELPVLGAQLGLPAGEREALAALATAHRLRAVIHTRGERGCLALVDGAWAEHPGVRVVVADTVGAGDAFTAAFALGLLRGWAPAVIVERATAVAAFVCTQRGATPALPPALTAPFRG